jgi:hypothetical protein
MSFLGFREMAKIKAPSPLSSPVEGEEVSKLTDHRSSNRCYGKPCREETDTMKRESVVRKNLDLLDEFMEYAFDHPEILDTIPRDQTLVILPEGDPALERQNRKTLRRLKPLVKKRSR